MKLWVIQVGEPLPFQDGRPMRTGMLMKHIGGHGHDVLWWASTFDHFAKKQLFDRNTEMQLGPGYRLKMLHGPAYTRNASVQRIMNHRALVTEFRKEVVGEKLPDLILCSYPTIELAVEVVRFGRRHKVPVIVDVRDLWPDVFAKALPAGLPSWLKSALLYPFNRMAKIACRGATHLIAVSQGMLRWGLRKADREATANDRVFPLGYRRGMMVPDDAAFARMQGVGVDRTKTICWFIGTFGVTYDVATVIEGARALQQRGRTDVQFVLSGDGDQRAANQAQAAGLSNVVFTGWLKPPEIAAMMELAHVGLVAYDTVPETLPNKLFEYMSAGLAVASSLGGETDELLTKHECGVIYRPHDVAGFVSALTPVLDDGDLRARMGANARRLYEADYDAAVVYRRFEEYLIERAGK